MRIVISCITPSTQAQFAMENIGRKLSSCSNKSSTGKFRRHCLQDEYSNLKYWTKTRQFARSNRTAASSNFFEYQILPMIWYSIAHSTPPLHYSTTLHLLYSTAHSTPPVQYSTAVHIVYSTVQPRHDGRLLSHNWRVVLGTTHTTTHSKSHHTTHRTTHSTSHHTAHYTIHITAHRKTHRSTLSTTHCRRHRTTHSTTHSTTLSTTPITTHSATHHRTHYTTHNTTHSTTHSTTQNILHTEVCTLYCVYFTPSITYSTLRTKWLNKIQIIVQTSPSTAHYTLHTAQCTKHTAHCLHQHQFLHYTSFVTRVDFCW